MFSKFFFVAFVVIPLTIAQAETLLDLEKELLQNNPEIAAARNQYLAASKVPIQAGTLPDPSLTFTDLGVGRPFSSLSDSDFGYRGFGIMQEFPYPGKLSLRSKVAQKASEAVLEQLRIAQIRLLSQLKTSVAEYAYLQGAIANAERYRALLDQLLEISEVRYKVGQGVQQDVLRAQVERSTVEEKLILLRNALESQRVSINALLNRDLSRTLMVQTLDAGAMNRAPTGLPSLDRLRQHLRERSPEVLEKLRQQEQKSLQLSLAKKEKYPDFAAGFQWQKTGAGFPDYYMTTFEVRIPVFYKRKQEPAIAQAQLELKASENETRATLVRMETELEQAHLNATTTAKLIHLYNEGIVPQGRLSLESSVTGYQVGKIEFINVLNSAAILLNYESETLRRSADHLKAIAKIEELVGEPLDSEENRLLQEVAQ